MILVHSQGGLSGFCQTLQGFRYCFQNPETRRVQCSQAPARISVHHLSHRAPQPKSALEFRYSVGRLLPTYRLSPRSPVPQPS